jgi:RNA polymerase sigma-70 factor (ECF subfamily)
MDTEQACIEESARIVAEGRRQHPDVVLDPARVTEHLRRLFADELPPQLHRADLYLACGCAEGVHTALRRFEGCYERLVASEAAKVDSAPQFVADATAAVWARLLAPRPGALPRIAEYAGLGALSGWVRVATVRAALNLARADKRPVHDADAVPNLGDAEGVELRYLKSRYRQACNEAIRAAFAGLSAEERNMLRLHHLDGLTVDELAPLYGVHRSTVARRIARVRESILSETKRRLELELGADPGGLDSLIRMLRSGMEVTLDRLLRSS